MEIPLKKQLLFFSRSTALMASVGAVQAGGLDRTGQSLSPLFEKGRYISVDIQHARPTLRGVDGRGRNTGDVAPNYSQWGFAYKQDITPNLSAMVMLTRPFGLDLRYESTQNSMFSGTQATVQTQELIGMARYRWNAQWSAHWGLRLQQSQGSIRLGGPAYGPLNGYRATFSQSTAPGYALGLTYERPDIALRVTGTYYSQIAHQVKTKENALPLTTTTPSKSPQSFNLDMQTGISARNVVFGQIRWVQWTALELRPLAFTTATKGGSLTDLPNTWTYTVGLGHKLNAMWSAFFAVAYEKRSKERLLSPLQPSTGRVGYTLGFPYAHQGVKVTPWISYQDLGDADISSGTVPMAAVKSSKALAAGIKVGFKF